MTSILGTIKKMLGIAEDYTVFDADIIVFINAALSVLAQLGVGKMPFVVTGMSETWADFFGTTGTDTEAAKQYVYILVRTAFDPPSSSFVLESMNKTKQELEWRMNVDVD